MRQGSHHVTAIVSHQNAERESVPSYAVVHTHDNLWLALTRVFQDAYTFACCTVRFAPILNVEQRLTLLALLVADASKAV